MNRSSLAATSLTWKIGFPPPKSNLTCRLYNYSLISSLKFETQLICCPLLCCELIIPSLWGNIVELFFLFSRRVNHHQSTGSLHSADSHSSNGGLSSPSPSPSPYRISPSPRAPVLNQHLRNGNGVGGTGTNGTTPSPLATKRWSSTSDFGNPSAFSPNAPMAVR